MTRNMLLIAAALAGSTAAPGQVVLPEGTKVRVRLEQTISSATAEEGQPVQLSVTEDVRAGDAVIIPQGASAVGTIVLAVPKRRMGRTGKLDFSVERVVAADGNSIPLRYSLNRKEGGSHATRTGIITAGAAVVFWPAAPVFLLMKGKDVTVNKGMVVEVFTDQKYALQQRAPANLTNTPAAPSAAPVPAPAYSAQYLLASTSPQSASTPVPAAGDTAAVKITSEPDGAEIELNGAFVGSTPTLLRLAPGMHNVTVRKGALQWRRTLQVQAGSAVNVNAVLAR